MEVDRLGMKKIIKNPILFVALAVAAIIILAAVFKPAPADEQSAAMTTAVLVTDNVFHDFGSISMANGKVSYDFVVKNTTGEMIDVKKLYTSCMCTEALFIRGDIEKGPFGMPGHGFVPPVNESLQSGEEVIIRVVFDPAAHGPAGIGAIRRSIYLEGDRSKLLELQFSAVVTP